LKTTMACKFVALLLGFCATAALAEVEPVSELDLVSYMGRWYQCITNGFAKSVSQPNCTCNTVEYGIDNSYRIVEDNRFNRNTPTGKLDRTTGYANLTDRPGVLRIKFDDIGQTFEYAVFALGGMTDLDQYEWAMVTDSGANSLYGLCRDYTDYNGAMKTAMLAAATAAGFDDDAMSRPEDVYHGSDCIYPEAFAPMVRVTALDVAMISGNYFMMYTNKFTRDTMFPNNYCTTFQLTVNGDGTLGLKIDYTESSAGGAKKSAMATVSTTATTGVLSALFDGATDPTELHVIKTGPVVDGKYEYVVITNNLKSALHILARDPKKFNKEYKQDVLDFAEKTGFNGLITTPIEQVQGSECSYPDGFEVGGAAQLASLSLACLLAISFLRFLL